jgi:putative membrane protein
MELLDQSKLPKVRMAIIALSIVVPVVVATLFKIKIEGFDASFLPPVYAGINALTAFVLIRALLAIKSKNITLHRSLIRFALLLSILFLVLYVAYHVFSDSTFYGDTNHDGKVDILEKMNAGWMAYVYYFLLVTHILLSMAVIPLVLFTYLAAWQGNYEKHKRMTRFTFPIWLYVAVTGVIVYFMVAPFYA